MTGTDWYRARTRADLGSGVAQIRKDAGLTQAGAAEQTRSSRPTISRLERGEVSSTALLLDLLAQCGYEAILVPRGTKVTVG